jgi:hypothetical protein
LERAWKAGVLYEEARLQECPKVCDRPSGDESKSLLSDFLSAVGRCGGNGVVLYTVRRMAAPTAAKRRLGGQKPFLPLTIEMAEKSGAGYFCVLPVWEF